jgi:glucose-6-phosphate 1-dehydrogenase
MSGEDVELNVMHQAAEEMDAYERLIGDAMKGDLTLFSREDSAEAQWRVVDPVLSGDTPVYDYDPGSWGPSQAEEIARGICSWHDPVVNGDHAAPTVQTRVQKRA